MHSQCLSTLQAILSSANPPQSPPPLLKCDWDAVPLEVLDRGPALKPARDNVGSSLNIVIYFSLEINKQCFFLLSFSSTGYKWQLDT